MFLVTISKAAGMPYAPTRAALYKQIKTAEAKQKPRPKYFVDDRGKVCVDIEHPDWEAFLESRGRDLTEKIIEPVKTPAKQKKKTTTTKKKTETKKQTKEKADTDGENNFPGVLDLLSPGNLELLMARSKIALYEKDILDNDGKRYLNEKKKLALMREARDVFEVKFAEFLYLGHIEKLHIELLMLCKKIEPMINNLVKKGDTKGVIDLFNRNFENILTEIKKAQADDLEEWEGEK